MQILDQFGNLTNGTAGVMLTIGTNPSSSTLTGILTQNASAGMATFSGLSIHKTGAGFTLVGAGNGLTGATSNGFNVTAGAASKLALTGRPSNSTGGSAISPPITVTLQDAGGNTVTTSGTPITLGISTGSGTTGATMTGASATTTNGVATFTGSTMDKSGNFTLTANNSGVPTATSVTFTVSHS